MICLKLPSIHFQLYANSSLPQKSIFLALAVMKVTHQDSPLVLEDYEAQCTLEVEIQASRCEFNELKFVTVRICDFHHVHLTSVLQPDTTSWRSRLPYFQHGVSSVVFYY